MTGSAEHPDVHLRAARLAAAMGRRDEAISAYEESLRLDPRPVAVRFEFAVALFEAERVVEAAEQFRWLVDADPRSATALGNLATCLSRIGRAEEATAAAKSAYRLSGDREHWSTALHASNGASELPEEEVVRDHLAYDSMVPRPAPPVPVPILRASGRPLRVGVVSADLRRHPVAKFLEPLLPRLAAAGVECHAFHANSFTDDVTTRLRGAFASWSSISTLDDRRALNLIRGRELDLMLDLSGHTQSHRLPLLALRVAPVQATWLGYPNTTGLRAMDWRIVDSITDPPGSESLCSERLLRVREPFLCFVPPADAAPTRRLPGARTFISLNHPMKLSRRTVSLWSRVLDAVPDARLLLRIAGLQDPLLVSDIRARFSAAGIAPDRVHFDPWRSDHERHTEIYRHADVSLDPFPYHGTTTTCESLASGVPVVTRLGGSHRSRVGATILRSVGLGDLVAEDDETFVRVASALVLDQRRLGDLRRTIPEQMRRSRLADADDLARSLADALREAIDAGTRAAGRRGSLP